MLCRTSFKLFLILLSRYCKSAMYLLTQNLFISPPPIHHETRFSVVVLSFSFTFYFLHFVYKVWTRNKIKKIFRNIKSRTNRQPFFFNFRISVENLAIHFHSPIPPTHDFSPHSLLVEKWNRKNSLIVIKTEKTFLFVISAAAFSTPTNRLKKIKKSSSWLKTAKASDKVINIAKNVVAR